MTTTAVRAARLPQPTPEEAERTSELEYAALLAMVHQFSADDWGRQTDCTLWTVRDMVAHLAGAAEEATQTRTALRRLILGMVRHRRLGGLPIDHTCAMQIAERSHLSDAELEADLRRWSATAPAGRRQQPGFVRRMKTPAVVGFRPGVNGSYTYDVIYNRDTWLHRVDLSRATGVDLVTSGGESEIIGQVVKDLDLEWRDQPLVLTLTGVGGGSWRIGDGEPVAEVTEDSVACMRLFSGRSDECTLDTTGDTSVARAVRAARVAF